MFVSNIYSDIRLYVSIILILIYPEIRSCQICVLQYIRTFFVSMKTIRIFLEFSVRICQIFVTNIFRPSFVSFFYTNMLGRSFVLKLLRMLHSEPESSLLITKHMSPDTGSHQITPNLINNACTWRPMRRFHVFATYTCYLR